MADEIYKVTQELEKEKSERILKLKELREEFKEEMAKQTNIVEEYQKKAVEEVNTLKTELMEEMDVRFAHQDEIIDNLSGFIKTFQDTLKVVSKNV